MYMYSIDFEVTRALHIISMIQIVHTKTVSPVTPKLVTRKCQRKDTLMVFILWLDHTVVAGCMHTGSVMTA